MKVTFTVFALSAALSLAGCKEDSDHTHTTTAPTGNVGAVMDDTHEGTPHDLGTTTVGGYAVSVTQLGDVKPGEEVVFEFAVTGEGEKPKAVRAWVGTESAEGSTKAKADAEGDAGGYHAHVELPATLPPQSKLWIEVETAAGKEKASAELKQ